MDYIKDLHELCETLSREVGEANEKIRVSGGKLSAGDLEYIDKLTHALKSVKSTLGMMEDEESYSGRYPYYYSGYDGGRGKSYARRDSRGRYSERGYSRNDLLDKVRDLMDEAPDEKTRQEMRRMVDKLENA